MLLKTLALIALTLLSFIPLQSCAALTPQQQSNAIATVNGMLANGSISQAQHDALVETITAGGATPLWQQGLQVLLGAGLGYVGVMRRRGPVTQEVGAPFVVGAAVPKPA